MSLKFKWDAWDFDCNGEAYIIAKRECSEKENVPEFIIKEDNLHPNCKDGMVIKEGVCKFMVRTDWQNGEGEPRGGYFVVEGSQDTKGKRGWFPVWIVRKGEWY